MKKDSTNKKNIFLLILRRVKISHLLLLVVLLAANSYAWFIYVNNVSNKIDVHVRAWKVDFEDDGQVVEEVNVSVDNAYPGMTDYSKEVIAHNYSDLPATASYVILSASIMGDNYTTVEGKADAGETVNGDELTSAQLITKLTTEYPFTFSFALSETQLEALTGTTTYTIGLTWPYESGDDEADTLWGVRAYNFKTEHPSDPCIELRIKIYVTQAES